MTWTHSIAASAIYRGPNSGDTAVRQARGAYVILRTSWVYAGRGHNFLGTILRLASEREELRIVDDQIGAPTWACNIADATALIIRAICQEQAQGQFAFGHFNLTASGTTSWHGFAKAILEDADALCLVTRATLVSTQAYPERRVSDAGRTAQKFSSCSGPDKQAIWHRAPRLEAGVRAVSRK